MFNWDFSPRPEGRGFSPAASKPFKLSLCLAARTVRRLTDCAGRETERREKPLTAGLKPRPSTSPAQNGRSSEKSRLPPHF
jgi:hypothetical protein